MADSTLDSELFWLADTLPGPVNHKIGPPIDGFTGAISHNVASAEYPLGTKIPVYNTGATGVAGWATFVYGQLFTQDATNILAARHLCALDDGAIPFYFSNEAATDIGASVSPIVIALSAMTATYYGWFWCEGVCPEESVSDLGGNYYTMGDVAIGPMTSADLATPGTTAGEIGFDLIDADTEVIVGYALAADA